VGGDYFEAMGVPILRGRYFSPMERATDAPVVIVDEVQARRLRPDGNAIGCLISISGFGPRPREVVGIVPGLRNERGGAEVYPHVYVPMGRNLQYFDAPVCLYVRTADGIAADDATLLQHIREGVHAVEPRVAILSLMTLADSHRQSRDMRQVRLVANLAAAFGATALFLAGLGIYGVKGYMVAARTPEIGIRMALGATSGAILKLVLREGTPLTLAGLTVGMLLTFAAARVMEHALFGVDPIDPPSIVMTVALLGVTSLLAGYIPARRASRVDPMAALRQE